MRCRNYFCLVVFWITSLCMGGHVIGATAATAPSNVTSAFLAIHSEGTRLVNSSGRQVILKGCNLGNWLLIEPWMFGGCIDAPDQAAMLATLSRRFGSDRAFGLMETYRSSWMVPRDFDRIRSFGFNVVRLPIDYRLLQSDQAPYPLKQGGFKWIDRAISMARDAGLYIILDLHSAPGGQSIDQCTGEVGQNKFWNNPMNEQREVDLWKALSSRYKDQSSVAGYDLMNEPYADHRTDVRADLRRVMSKCYAAIRQTGDQHVLFFPALIWGAPDFYEEPRKAGWTNVGFTEHFYPGLFGDKVVLEGHLTALEKVFPAREKWLEQVQAPFYVGEFNPVLDSSGGVRVTRAYFDAFADRGWAGTLWSYKLIKLDAGARSSSWYCVSNAARLPRLNLDSSSYEEFEDFFAKLATISLAVDEPLMNALTRPDRMPLQDAGNRDRDSAVSLLKNGSFELPARNAGEAEHWITKGPGLTRQTDWTPTHSGTALMGYHHWEIKSSAATELSQEIEVKTGERYRFTIFAMRDDPKGDQNTASVDLKMFGKSEGHVVTLNTAEIKSDEIAAGHYWTELTVEGTAMGDTMRVSIVITPAASGPRGGAIKFDDASLTGVPAIGAVKD